MPIEFTCPGFQKILRVADTAAGKRARCPDCGQIAHVPSSGGHSSAGSTAGENTWSTGDWAPNEPPIESGNPFASPHQASAMHRPYLSLHDIKQKVAPPAIGLMVIAILNLLILFGYGSLMMIGMVGAIQGGPNAGGPAADDLVFMAILAGGFLLVMVRDGLVLYGAVQMKGIKSYSMALTGTILALVPCNYFCCYIQLPIAIWALIILNDADVKNAFRNAQSS